MKIQWASWYRDHLLQSVRVKSWHFASVQSLSMNYSYTSTKLRAIGFARTAPKVQGVGAWACGR